MKRLPSDRAGVRGRRVRSGQAAQKAGGVVLLAGLYVALYLLERRSPLRPASESKLRRNARNLAVAGLTAAAMQLAERPVVQPLARAVERHKFGMLPLLGLPRWAESILAIALMDYTLYLWHVLAHRVPGLWRFHRVHHSDLDLDASTALRFHFGEIVISVAWRAAQVGFLGVRPGVLQLWQNFLFASILFHHSNLRLPHHVERVLCRWVMTPRLHGIHHSTGPEGESNWSSGLTLWDWLHGTLRADVPQRAFAIGVRDLRDPEQLRLPKIVAMPFLERGQISVPARGRTSRRLNLAE